MMIDPFKIHDDDFQISWDTSDQFLTLFLIFYLVGNSESAHKNVESKYMMYDTDMHAKIRTLSRNSELSFNPNQTNQNSINVRKVYLILSAQANHECKF